MKPLHQFVLGAALVCLITGGEANGQLFGERQLGRTLRPRSPSAFESGTAVGPNTTGTLRNQRFLRQNRGRGSFVGRTRSRSFVGSQQATTAATVATAVSPTIVPTTVDVNQPFQRASSDRPYDPPLTVGFAHPARSASELANSIADQLSRFESQIEVSVVDRVATLRGVVASEDERRMIGLLAGFEPGISAVRNELLLVPAADIPPPPAPGL